MIHKTCSFLFLATLLAHHSQSTSPPLTLPPATTNISFNPSNYKCVDKPEWTTQSFLAGDCYSALDKFHNRKVDRYSSMTVEFYAANVTPYYPSHFWQATPQKYKYKTCTLAIVMLRDMPPSEVPVTTAQSTDLSSYLYIEMAARTVLKECLSVVLPNGKASGGALGFVNPTGYDIVGTCLRLLLLLLCPWSFSDHPRRIPRKGRAWLMLSLCDQETERPSASSYGIRIPSSIEGSRRRILDRIPRGLWRLGRLSTVLLFGGVISRTIRVLTCRSYDEKNDYVLNGLGRLVGTRYSPNAFPLWDYGFLRESCRLSRRDYFQHSQKHQRLQ